jgi:mono/diheme cytochrome c family protein
MNRKVLAIAVLIVVGFFTYTAFASRATGPKVAATGDVLYERHCAACHGINLEGQANWQTQNADGSMPAPPHDETGHTWHHRDKYLIEVTLYGGAAVTGNPLNRMPAFGHVLSEAETRAIFTYIKSTWSDEIRELQKNGH